MMKPMSKDQRNQLAYEYWKWFSEGTELHAKTELNLIKKHILKTEELKTLFQKISDYWKIGNITGSNHLEQTIKKLILLEDDIKSPFELMKDLKENITMSDIEKSNIYFKKTKYNEFRSSEFKHKFLFKYFPVCPYCNTTYLFKLREEDIPKKITNYVGAQLDHYYPKDDYPYLAISIFNLVPSCPTCNHIKGNKEDHLYPYTEEMGNDAKFIIEDSFYGKLSGIFFDSKEEDRRLAHDGFERVIKLDIKEGALKDKIANSNRIFQLENKYSNLKEEVKDLYFKHNMTSDSFKDELRDQFASLNLTDDEIKEIYYGVKVKEEEHHKRPLSKFINDLIEDLDSK